MDDIAPSAPVKDFRFPRFGENGYTQWVLNGAEGIYDSEEQIRVTDMGLRVYTGDERMAVEMSLDSPAATLRLKENKAFSDSVIEIVGRNFKITGLGWTWDGTSKEIEVLEHSIVEFTQALSDTVGGGGAAADTGELQTTVIESQRLKLRTTEKFYYFNFRDNVHVISADMDLRCKALLAVADAPEGEDKKSSTPQVVAPGKLESLNEIRARGDVVIMQSGRVVRAGAADFFPRQQLVNLGDQPSVEVSGAYIAGQFIRIEQGEIEITGAEGAGRAQVILPQTGGLGIQGVSALSSETIVLADRILMREMEQENRFIFEGSVEVMSGALQMRSASMTIFANKASERPQPDAGAEADASRLNVGEVRQLVAEGSVHIEQNGQIATGDKVVFHPLDESAELTGNPRVTNGEAVVTGTRMQLKQGLAIVEGRADERVSVSLPVLPDMGYTGMEALSTGPQQEGEPVESKPTVIQSQLVRMIEAPEATRFEFRDDVQVSATNLEATCQRMDVIARQRKVPAGEDQLDENLQVESIEANGDVMIQQTGRVATSEKALILPVEGRFILEGNAVVTDDQGRVSGHRLLLNQGERRAIIEGGAGQRAKITLPDMDVQ